MQFQPETSILEAANLVLELRKNLHFEKRGFGPDEFFLVEDRLNSRYYRLGPAERAFVSFLNGRKTIHQAYAELSRAVPGHRLTDADAIALCQWLVSMDLAHTPESAQADRLAQRAKTQDSRKLLSNLNPLSFRLSLAHPDGFFERILPWTSFLFSPAAVLGCVLLLVVGMVRLLADWERFCSGTQGVFAPHNWIWIGACGGVLKLLHELGHGIACRRLGGQVRQAGLMFVLFVPMPFLDVTSSWRFTSAWKRMQVAAAGMYIELFVASLSAIIWSSVEPGWLSHLCHNTLIAASLTTIIFNANPLMKFDGYYILSDLLGITNLYSNGQRVVQGTVRRILFKISTAQPNWSAKRHLLVAFYGWSSFIWRSLLSVSLILSATTLFGQASVVLAVLACLTWIAVPLYQWSRAIVQSGAGQPDKLVRGFAILGILIASSLTAIFLLPWPGAIRAPAVVEYAPLTQLRAGVSGFVRQVNFARNQSVRTGEVLFVLENKELTTEIQTLEIQVRQSEARQRQFERKGELASKQAEAETRHALEVRLHENRKLAENLQVRAPRSGTVLLRYPRKLLDTFVKQGDELACLGDESVKEIRASIAQDDVDGYTHRIGQSISLQTPVRDVRICRLEKIVPRAASEIVHPALTTLNGGPIPVKQAAADDFKSKTILFEPRLEAILSLGEAQSIKMLAGQRVTISTRPFNESIATCLYKWLHQKIRFSLERPS